MTRDEQYYDYLYEVWRSGGNPDAIDREDVPADFDWVYDKPLPEHLPKNQEDEYAE